MCKTVKKLMMIGLVLSLTGCISAGPLIRPGEPVGTLEIVNNSGHHLGAILLVDCDGSTYGSDRLPDDYVIKDGTSYKFNLSAGCWSIKAYAMSKYATNGQAIVEGNKITMFAIGAPKKNILE